MYKIFFLLLTSVLFLSCGRRPEYKARDLAIENLKLSVDNPDQLKVLSVSRVDSAFGTNYFTDSEIRRLFESSRKVSEKVMKLTDNLTHLNNATPALLSLIERQMKSSSEVRSLLLHPNKKGAFSGYKFRINYQSQDTNGITYKAERWFFTDPKGKQIIRSFEVPLL